MDRDNLDVRTKTLTTRVNLEAGRATGITCMKGDREVQFKATKEVILSGGVINSPQLLQLSGIGPAPLLQSLGIAVVHDLAGVGENLRDHYAPRFSMRVKNIETINERSRGIRLAGEIFKYFAGGKSIVNLSPSMVYGFWHSDAVARSNDLQFIFTPASLQTGRARAARRSLCRWTR